MIRKGLYRRMSANKCRRTDRIRKSQVLLETSNSKAFGYSYSTRVLHLTGNLLVSRREKQLYKDEIRKSTP